ncbi:MAG: hypothetical protein ACJ0FY_00890 [Gammaproteobacteria bacterium]|nr:MAG: hypothetical protein CBE02_02460 [Gammaproteobacteria bacterium TMED242]|tara:strand:- start:662 stop:874 length:213 start_codon:yes stop_codon:yes gene_type:complete
MDNVIKFKPKDIVLKELECSIDKESTKKMLAFKYFNNDFNALTIFLSKHKTSEVQHINYIEPKRQLEFSF